MKNLASILLLVATFSVSNAKAEDSAWNTITISPFHLPSGIVEGAYERAVVPQFSITAILGAGKFKRLYWVQEYGAQLRYYFSEFKGAQIGGEMLYIHLDDNSGEVVIKGNGLALGPLGGYKWIWNNGFTLSLQGGMQYLAIEGKASYRDISAKSKDDRRVLLLNVDLGYSF